MLTTDVFTRQAGEILKLMTPAPADADPIVDEAAEWMRTVYLHVRDSPSSGAFLSETPSEPYGSRGVSESLTYSSMAIVRWCSQHQASSVGVERPFRQMSTMQLAPWSNCHGGPYPGCNKAGHLPVFSQVPLQQVLAAAEESLCRTEHGPGQLALGPGPCHLGSQCRLLPKLSTTV
jgi:hypothetical protein